jgi:hypothetical protein
VVLDLAQEGIEGAHQRNWGADTATATAAATAAATPEATEDEGGAAWGQGSLGGSGRGEREEAHAPGAAQRRAAAQHLTDHTSLLLYTHATVAQSQWLERSEQCVLR